MSVLLAQTLAALGPDEREAAQLALNILGSDAAVITEAEREVILGLAAALVDPHPVLYSHVLCDVVTARQLAGHGVIQTLRECWEDPSVDLGIRTMMFALACELAGAVRAVDAIGPASRRRRQCSTAR